MYHITIPYPMLPLQVKGRVRSTRLGAQACLAQPVMGQRTTTPTGTHTGLAAPQPHLAAALRYSLWQQASPLRQLMVAEVLAMVRMMPVSSSPEQCGRDLRLRGLCQRINGSILTRLARAGAHGRTVRAQLSVPTPARLLLRQQSCACMLQQQLPATQATLRRSAPARVTTWRATPYSPAASATRLQRLARAV